MRSRMVDYSLRDAAYKSIEKQGEVQSPDLANTQRSLKEEIKSWKQDTNKMIKTLERISKAQEK